MNKDAIRFWAIAVFFLFLGNAVAEYLQYKVAKSYEYCNEDGYWVKTSFTGRPTGIAMYTNGKAVTCEYKVEDSK